MNTIKIARNFFGVTISEMAKALNVSEQQVGNWECGFRHPSSASAKMIGEYLGVDDAWVLGCPQSLSVVNPSNGGIYSGHIMTSEHIDGIGTFSNIYVTEFDCVVATVLASGTMYTVANWGIDRVINSSEIENFSWIDADGNIIENLCIY